MNDTKSKNDVEVLRRAVSLLRENAKLDEEPGELVACMSDSNLKEYLLPQIQIPFINPTTTDAYIES